MDADPHDPSVSERAPVFRAPWPAVVLALSLPVLYLLQSRVLDETLLVEHLALVPAEMFRGHLLGLGGSLLLHGGWVHALMNAGALLVFATPLSRRFGSDPTGAGLLLALYIVCGMVAGLAYALLNPHSLAPLIGASGAVFGLVGASTRLMGLPPWAPPRPLLDRRVSTQLAVWTGTNLLLALPVALSPGVEPGQAVAWQAHVAGLLAGALLVGPWTRLRPARPPI